MRAKRDRLDRWAALCAMLAACLAGAVCWLASPPAHGDEAFRRDETWEVICIDEQRVGHARRATEWLAVGGRRILRTRSDEFMRVKRLGDTIEISTHLVADEAPDGEMLAFEVETRNPPAAATRTVGRVDGGWLHLETTVDGRTRRERIAWKAGTKSPVYADRLLRSVPWRPGQSVSFEAFEPIFNKSTTVKLTADDVRPVKLLDGREENLLRVRIVKSVLPEIVSRAYLAADPADGEHRRTRKIETGLMGVVAYDVPKEVALESLAGRELDLVVRHLIRVPAIPQVESARSITYRLTMRDADPARFLVSGGTQTIKPLGPDSLELTVRRLDPPPRAVRAQPVDGQFLSATQYLQIHDPHVQEHARRAAAGELDPLKAALRMERYVFEKLKKKDFSTGLASAAEVARSLEGDCTEHALLLAALLRAQKIPARIAAGLVYVERHSAFAGHMWTEAWVNNAWVPLDATRGRGGIGPEYIKQAESSFADQAASPATVFVPLVQALDSMQIEVVSVQTK